MDNLPISRKTGEILLTDDGRIKRTVHRLVISAQISPTGLAAAADSSGCQASWKRREEAKETRMAKTQAAVDAGGPRAAAMRKLEEHKRKAVDDGTDDVELARQRHAGARVSTPAARSLKPAKRARMAAAGAAVTTSSRAGLTGLALATSKPAVGAAADMDVAVAEAAVGAGGTGVASSAMCAGCQRKQVPSNFTAGQLRKGTGQYTAEQCVQAILKQDKSNNAERNPAAKLMLRRQKRLDRMVSEGNVKLELGSSEYYLYLFSEYCRAWPREFGMDADSAQRVSDIRRISHLLRRARCYWGLSPIEYWDKLQELVAALDALHHPFPLSEMNTIWADTFYPRHLRTLTDAMKTKCEEGTLCAHDIRTYLFDAGKIIADESLRGEQNYARLSVTYDMNSEAENLSDHEDSWSMKKATPAERTAANGYLREGSVRKKKKGSKKKLDKTKQRETRNPLIPPSSDSEPDVPLENPNPPPVPAANEERGVESEKGWILHCYGNSCEPYDYPRDNTSGAYIKELREMSEYMGGLTDIWPPDFDRMKWHQIADKAKRTGKEDLAASPKRITRRICKAWRKLSGEERMEYRRYRECGKEPEKPGNESADSSDRDEGSQSTEGSCKAGSATDVPADFDDCTSWCSSDSA
jgi:hypothetical protein